MNDLGNRARYAGTSSDTSKRRGSLSRSDSLTAVQGLALKQHHKRYERLKMRFSRLKVFIKLLRKAIRDAGGMASLAVKSWRVSRAEGSGGVKQRIHFVWEKAAEKAAKEKRSAERKLKVAAKAKARLLKSPQVPAVRASPRKILVADYRIPMADVSAGERVTVSILRDLRELGYEVTFLPNNLVPSPKYEAELLALGLQVITSAQGYDSPTDYLDLHGYEFAAFYLFRVDVAECLLSVIRKVAPAARLIFHAPDLYSLREARHAEIENSERAKARAQRTRQRELAIMRGG